MLTTMLKLTRFVLALSGAQPPRYIRSITIQSTKQHELRQKVENEEETDKEEEALDEFTKEFLGNKIKVSDFQRLLLTAGSSIAALLNPRRQDMIACLGETTGEEALHSIFHVMKSSEEGRLILKEKPRINTKTVNLNELKNMDVESFGYHYYKFLEDNVSYIYITFVLCVINQYKKKSLSM